MAEEKSKKPVPTQKPQRTTLDLAAKAIAQIAQREHTTPEMVRKHIQVGMMNGLLSSDPEVQAAWKRIPCIGEIPTPEEVIAYYADKLKRK